ncbi:MAG: SGNH/GDSL hydrolase family protein, partial [Pseudomonadota bacterium]
MRNFTLSSLVLAIAAFTSSAASNPYPDVYFFGDSILDNGQFDGLRFTNRVGPNYLTSPFGEVSPAYITEGLNAPYADPSRVGGTNYAVGGNRSEEVLDSVTAESTYLAPYAVDRPGEGLDPVFNSLFYDLERTGESFQKNALYILDGGGNDLGGGLVFDDATAEIVADNMVNAATA